MCVRGYLDYIEKPKEYIKNPGNSQVPDYTQKRSGFRASADLTGNQHTVPLFFCNPDAFWSIGGKKAKGTNHEQNARKH